MIKSAAQFFREAHGKNVVKRISGWYTIETIDNMIEDIKRAVTERGLNSDELIIDYESGTIYINNYFWRIPKEHAETHGKFFVRSQDYYFIAEGSNNPVYGDKRDSKVIDNRLVKTYDNGRTITFEIA